MSFNLVKTALSKACNLSRSSCIVVVDNNRRYSKWMHRHPSKVYIKESNISEEQIIDLDPEILKQGRDHIKITSENITTPRKSSIRTKPEPKNVVNKENTSQQTFVDDENTEIGKEFVKKVQKKTRTLQSVPKTTQTKVFDDNGDIIYEKLKDNDSRIGVLLTQLKSKKDRAQCGQVMVEGWRMILDGLKAKCKLNYIIFSRIDDLEVLKPLMPKSGVKLYKIPYKEIELWSNVETASGIIGIFESPNVEEMKVSPRLLPIELICDNIRVPGNLGAILRAALGAGVQRIYLTKGCVDLWDPKVLRSGAGAHFRMPVEMSLGWNDIQKKINTECSVFIADSNSKVILTEGLSEKKNQHYKEQISDLGDLNLPVVPYYSVEYGTLPAVTLIIGGETEGISEESYRFAASRNGVRLNIPLEHGVDSLNTGMATAVIVFEIKKKMVEQRLSKRASVGESNT